MRVAPVPLIDTPFVANSDPDRSGPSVFAIATTATFSADAYLIRSSPLGRDLLWLTPRGAPWIKSVRDLLSPRLLNAE